ncbi:MAG: hypothetical protein AB1467_06650 [Candidatus Diapherotrites archaeon]
MNWNANGKRRKECNNLKAVRHFNKILGLCRNPSRTLTNIAMEW